MKKVLVAVCLLAVSFSLFAASYDPFADDPSKESGTTSLYEVDKTVQHIGLYTGTGAVVGGSIGAVLGPAGTAAGIVMGTAIGGAIGLVAGIARCFF